MDYHARAMQTMQLEDKAFREHMGEQAEKAFRAAAAGKRDLRTVVGQATAGSLNHPLQSYGLETTR